MKRNLLYVTLVFAVACNETDSGNSSLSSSSIAQNNEILAKAADCSNLSQADQNNLVAVEAKLAAKLGQMDGLGPFHPDYAVNTIEEIAAYGCASSAPVLLADAQDIDSRVYLGNTGILEIRDAERFRTLLIALHLIAPNDPLFQSLLIKYSNETRQIRDGSGGFNIQQEAKYLQQAAGTIYRPYLKGYMEQWNADFGNCSTQYIQADGSTLSYIPNWNTYFASISQLPANSPIRSLIAKSRFFCDGYNGYEIHSKAIEGFSLGSHNQTLAALVDFANAHRVRGSVVGAQALERVLYINTQDFNESQVGEAVGLMMDQFLGGSGNAIFPEENVRKKAVGVVENVCFRYKRFHGGTEASACVGAFEYLESETSKKDPGREVRLAALLALANLEYEQNAQ